MIKQTLKLSFARDRGQGGSPSHRKGTQRIKVREDAGTGMRDVQGFESGKCENGPLGAVSGQTLQGQPAPRLPPSRLWRRLASMNTSIHLLFGCFLRANMPRRSTNVASRARFISSTLCWLEGVPPCRSASHAASREIPIDRPRCRDPNEHGNPQCAIRERERARISIFLSVSSSCALFPFAFLFLSLFPNAFVVVCFAALSLF